MDINYYQSFFIKRLKPETSFAVFQPTDSYIKNLYRI